MNKTTNVEGNTVFITKDSSAESNCLFTLRYTTWRLLKKKNQM